VAIVSKLRLSVAAFISMLLGDDAAELMTRRDAATSSWRPRTLDRLAPDGRRTIDFGLRAIGLPIRGKTVLPFASASVAHPSSSSQHALAGTHLHHFGTGTSTLNRSFSGGKQEDEERECG
jgi:hypothetical protein